MKLITTAQYNQKTIPLMQRRCTAADPVHPADENRVAVFDVRISKSITEYPPSREYAAHLHRALLSKHQHYSPTRQPHMFTGALPHTHSH